MSNKEKLVLVIENGCQHFYTESGERIDYLAGTTVKQENAKMWASGQANYEANLYVFGVVIGDKERNLDPCIYDKDKNIVFTPRNLTVIDAKVILKIEFEGKIELVRIKGICLLNYETKHKEKENA